MTKTKGENKTNQSTNYVLLEHVFKNLHTALYFYAIKFVKSEEIAKDLVQDAFLSLIGSDSDIKNLKTYLFSTVRNNCLNYIKKKEVHNNYILQEQQRTIREIEFYDIHQTIVEEEHIKRLHDEIESLPENYKTVIQLSRFEELKNKEIAEMLNLPIRTVETQIYRALNLLRKKFRDQNISLLFIIYSKSGNQKQS